MIQAEETIMLSRPIVVPPPKVLARLSISDYNFDSDMDTKL